MLSPKMDRLSPRPRRRDHLFENTESPTCFGSSSRTDQGSGRNCSSTLPSHRGPRDHESVAKRRVISLAHRQNDRRQVAASTLATATRYEEADKKYQFYLADRDSLQPATIESALLA